MRKALLAATTLAALGAGVAFGALHLYRQPGRLTHSLDVVIPKGGFAAVAERLRAAGVVESAWQLRAAKAATDWQGPVRAAELSFPQGASLERVLLVLRQGRPVQHLLTVPEGVTAARVAAIVAEARGLTGEIVLPEEGGFLPESYAYVLGDNAGSVLRRGRVAMAGAVQRVWADRASGLPLRSARELVILASLVERETHVPAERAVVAAVFVNRLRLGMKLQTDPTLEYAASGGLGELGHGLRRDEMAVATPYNSYAFAGLPGGAICDPGRLALEAAAHPAASDALYFVADGTGGHAFARSLAEHDANVARYRLRAR